MQPEIQRAMQNLPVNSGMLIHPDDLRPDNIVGPQNPQGQEVPPLVQRDVPQDVARTDAVENGNGLNLQPGDGQAEQFAVNHQVASGRDWDMNSAEGMLDTVHESVAHIKKQIAGAEVIDSYVNSLIEAAAHTANAHPDMDIQGLSEDIASLKQIAIQLKEARAMLASVIKDSSGEKDPREALEQIRKTLRVFRYETQKALDVFNLDSGKMGINEGNLRGLQNLFTFKIDRHVGVSDLTSIFQAEKQLTEKIADIRNRMREVDRGTVPPPPLPPVMPPNLLFKNTIGDTLELSHRTNDQIRDFQDRDYTTSTLRGIVGPLAQKGGSRKVEFKVGVGALIGLGFSSVATAGLRAGARVCVIGQIDAPGKGRPISVTFRLAGGLEAKIGVEAGEESEIAGAKAQARASGEISHFTTRSYATLDDLILDASRCKLATSRTIGGVIVGGLKALGHSIGALGTKFFRWLGRKSGEVKQDNAQYLQSLKNSGIAGKLDRLLAKRGNPLIVAERKGWTAQFQGEAKGSIKVVDGIVNLGASVNASHERDFKVKAESYTTVVRVMKDAKDISSLNALMRPAPEGGDAGAVPRAAGNTPQEILENLETSFDDTLQEAEEVAERSGKLFAFTDTVGFARAANKFRTLLLETELAAREGRISRADADRLLNRYSNPSVKFPPDIYREYFMEGTGAAKPAKIRNSASASFQASLFSDWSDGLTSGIGNSIVKAVAAGGVKEMRHQIGLDTTFQYRFSSEKPAHPGTDPRPWENAVKTTHELAITASTPTRIILDAITRTVVNKGERLENQSNSVAKDTAKGVVKDMLKDSAKGAITAMLPGLILAGVKEAAVAGVKKWLSNPENVMNLVMFALEHVGDALDLVVGAVEFVVEHPELTIQVAASVMGTSSLGEAERNKVLKWSFVNGELESIALSSETKNTLGVNVDPVGVGLGLGFDISYSVTESVKEREYCPRPSLTSLLGKGEEFLFGETGLEPAGGGQPFKNWLARNAKGVEHMLGTLNDRKNLDIYERAMAQAQGDFDLQVRLQDAWNVVQALPADADLDAKVDAAHNLLVAMVLAYRTDGQEA